MRFSHTLPEPRPESHSGTTSRWLDEISHCENRLAAAIKEATLGEFLIQHILDAHAIGMAPTLDPQLAGTAEAFGRIKADAAATLAGATEVTGAPERDGAFRFRTAFNRMTEIEGALGKVSVNAAVAAAILAVLQKPFEAAIGGDSAQLLLGAADAAARTQALAQNYSVMSSTTDEGAAQ